MAQTTKRNPSGLLGLPQIDHELRQVRAARRKAETDVVKIGEDLIAAVRVTKNCGMAEDVLTHLRGQLSR